MADTEAERQRQYKDLIERGLSDGEARGTVWPGACPYQFDEGTFCRANGGFGCQIWSEDMGGRCPVVEALAALEHDQWVKWSKNLAERESLSPDRLERWVALWVPYTDLSEEMKEQDRIWARKVMSIISTINETKV